MFLWIARRFASKSAAVAVYILAGISILSMLGVGTKPLVAGIVTSMLHEQICRSTHLSRCLVVHCAKHATQELCINCLAHADTAIEWASRWLPVL